MSSTASEPAAVTAVNEEGTSPVVLLCEHASNHIPPEYGRLGLEPKELQRHIAWDPGAAVVARRLSVLLDAPLFLTGYSRLLIDCNRPLGAPTSIPVRSESTDIPGNAGLDQAERDRRATRFFVPFRDRVAAFLDARRAARTPTVVIGIHTFTPIFLGERRPWHCGVLYAGAADLAGAILDGLRDDPSLVVGENEPYRIEADHDHTVPVFGDGRGIPAALIELRQDLVGEDMRAEAWADRLAPILAAAAR